MGDLHGAVAGVVGIEVGVVSGVFNLESSGVDAPDWRPRHEELSKLDATLMRRRYGRRPKSTSDDDDGLVAVTGHRHGHRSRSLTGTFGRVEIEVPRARLHGQDGEQ